MEQINACLWEATAAPPPSCPPLQGAVEVEVAIVGAGYAGLSTALHLAEAGHSVCVLEAGEPGAGASGRNGGQVIAGLRHYASDLVAKYGPAIGARAHAFGAAAADTTFGTIARLGIDCDARQGGWMGVVDTAAGLSEIARRAATWQKRGVPVRLLTRDETIAITGTPAYLGGWIDPRGGTVQPLSLARGLARSAQAAGAAVHGRSRAVSITREGAAWRVRTGNGHVSACRLLLATNALTGALWPRLHQMILPVWSFQIATAPMEGVALPDGMAVSDLRRVLRYFRRDRDGRVVVGGKGTLSAPRDAGAFRLQQQHLARLYPALRNAPVEFRWGGLVGVLPDRLPRIVDLGPGAMATLGCNGKGVAWNIAMGRVLAESLVTGRNDALPIPVTPVAPIPMHGLRRAYVAAGATWARAQDRWGGGVGAP